MAVNKAILVGFVGIDPEVRYLDSGTPVANFRMATSETYTNRNGEKITQTEWHNIVLWRKLAEIAEKYVRKGSQLYIEGRIRTRSWDDKDGNKRYTTEIIADTLQMLDRKGSSSNDEGNYQGADNYSGPNDSTTPNKGSSHGEGEDEQVDDLPF